LGVGRSGIESMLTVGQPEKLLVIPDDLSVVISVITDTITSGSIGAALHFLLPTGHENILVTLDSRSGRSLVSIPY